MNDHPWLGQRAAPRHGQGTFRRRVWGKTGVRTPGETLALDRRGKMGPFVHAQEAQDMSPCRPSVICRLSLNIWPLVIMVIARGRKAARGRKVSPAVCEPLMLMLPLAEARLRHALCREAFGWNLRGGPPTPLFRCASTRDAPARLRQLPFVRIRT